MSDAPRIYPTLTYRDARAAIAFLVEKFGFVEHAVHESGGQVAHAELAYDTGMVMLGTAGAGDPLFDLGPVSLYVAVDDVDAHHDRAARAGADILRKPVDQDYGSREYVAKDPESNIWTFGTYRPAP